MEIDFSFIATFLSLFFGLAIMNALACISSYIQNFKKLENYWLWWIWALCLITLTSALWWNLFDIWADIKVWERYYFLFLTFYSALLYLIFDIFFDNYKYLDNKLPNILCIIAAIIALFYRSGFNKVSKGIRPGSIIFS